jgi:hypothetical protein
MGRGIRNTKAHCMYAALRNNTHALLKPHVKPVDLSPWTHKKKGQKASTRRRERKMRICYNCCSSSMSDPGRGLKFNHQRVSELRRTRAAVLLLPLSAWWWCFVGVPVGTDTVVGRPLCVCVSRVGTFVFVFIFFLTPKGTLCLP